MWLLRQLTRVAVCVTVSHGDADSESRCACDTCGCVCLLACVTVRERRGPARRHAKEGWAAAGVQRLMGEGTCSWAPSPCGQLGSSQPVPSNGDCRGTHTCASRTLRARAYVCGCVSARACAFVCVCACACAIGRYAHTHTHARARRSAGRCGMGSAPRGLPKFPNSIRQQPKSVQAPEPAPRSFGRRWVHGYMYRMKAVFAVHGHRDERRCSMMLGGTRRVRLCARVCMCVRACMRA